MLAQYISIFSRLLNRRVSLSRNRENQPVLNHDSYGFYQQADP